MGCGGGCAFEIGAGARAAFRRRFDSWTIKKEYVEPEIPEQQEKSWQKVGGKVKRKTPGHKPKGRGRIWRGG